MFNLRIIFKFNEAYQTFEGIEDFDNFANIALQFDCLIGRYNKRSIWLDRGGGGENAQGVINSV